MTARPTRHYLIPLLAGAATFGLGAAHALGETVTYDFNDLSHGQIVDESSDFTNDGLTVTGYNTQRDHHQIVAFDTTMTGTNDPDLEAPFTPGNAAGETFNTALIIQEQKNGEPDDEGSRPVGYMDFRFDHDLTSFGFDLLDLDGRMENDPAHAFARFYDGEIELGEATYRQFAAMDNSIAWGNNSANHLGPVDVSMAEGIESFDRVRLSFEGSAAVDNVVVSRAVPSPAAWAGGASLLALGGAGLWRRRRTAG